MADREENIFMAKCAEQAERYQEMVEYMRKVAELNVELTVEERNLLSVAYKNVVGARRASWRVITAVEQQQQDPARLELVKAYRKKVEVELAAICHEIVDLLDKNLIPACTSEESKVFHYKLKGDYFRYLAEFTAGDERSEAKKSAGEAYASASKFALQLATTHPIRLGLALNYSVFHYEIADDPEKACSLAKEAFEAAIEELDTLTGEEYRDSTLIMQLLKDNLTLWTNDDEDDADGEMEDADD